MSFTVIMTALNNEKFILDCLQTVKNKNLKKINIQNFYKKKFIKFFKILIQVKEILLIELINKKFIFTIFTLIN
mgnify:CR=1 FL=1